MAAAGLAAAAGFMIAASNTGSILVVKTSGALASHATVAGAVLEPVLLVNLQAQNQAVRVDRLTFAVTADTDGSFASIENNIAPADHISLCALNDSQGHPLGQGRVVDRLGNVSFTGLPILLKANTSANYSINCSFASVPVDGTNPDIYAFSLKNDASVSAKDYTGRQMSGSRVQMGGATDPGVNIPPSVSVTVRDSGTLSAALSGTTPSANIALAGTPLVNTASYVFTATNEPFTIQTLTLKNVGDDQAIQAVKIKYLDQLGATVVRSAMLSNHSAKFTGLNMYVPAGASSSSAVDVAVDTAPITATSPARSNMTFQMDLDFSAAGNFKATAFTSRRIITESVMGANIHANAMVLRKTRPYFSLSASSPSGSSVPSTQQEVLRFNVSAAPGGSVPLRQIMFRLNATDNDSTGWNNCGDGAVTKRLGTGAKWLVKNLTTGAVVSDLGDWSILKADGNACGQSVSPATYAVVNFGASMATGFPVILPQTSSTMTFALYLDTSGASANSDDTIQASIVSESTANETLHASLLWDDADTGATNINGTYITTNPITGNTLVF